MCSRLESSQEKRHNLQSDSFAGLQFAEPVDSLPSTESGADLQDRSDPVMRNSCALSSLSSLAVLPPRSEFKSVDGLGDVLPLPVQTVNLETIDSADMSSSLLQCSAAAAEPGCVAVTTPQLGSAEIPQLRTESTRMEVGQLPALSITTSGHKLPTLSSASQNSMLFNPSQQSSALVPANGLVISVTTGSSAVKTSTTQTQRLFIPQTVAPLNRAIVISPSTSITTNNVWSSGTSSVGIRGGQFVHLTVPTMWNLTGTNIQIRQYVSVPSRTVSSSGNILVGSQTVPHTVLSEACTMTTAVSPASTVGSMLQQSATSVHQLQMTSMPVSHGHVTSDPLSTQPACSDSVCCLVDSVTEMPVSCSTPPVNHDENSQFDPTSCEVYAPMRLLHDSVIANIPTPDPSCSSQE